MVGNWTMDRGLMYWYVYRLDIVKQVILIFKNKALAVSWIRWWYLSSNFVGDNTDPYGTPD